MLKKNCLICYYLLSQECICRIVMVWEAACLLCLIFNWKRMQNYTLPKYSHVKNEFIDSKEKKMLDLNVVEEYLGEW